MSLNVPRTSAIHVCITSGVHTLEIVCPVNIHLSYKHSAHIENNGIQD